MKTNFSLRLVWFYKISLKAKKLIDFTYFSLGPVFVVMISCFGWKYKKSYPNSPNLKQQLIDLVWGTLNIKSQWKEVHSSVTHCWLPLWISHKRPGTRGAGISQVPEEVSHCSGVIYIHRVFRVLWGRNVKDKSRPCQ